MTAGVAALVNDDITGMGEPPRKLLFAESLMTSAVHGVPVDWHPVRHSDLHVYLLLAAFDRATAAPRCRLRHAVVNDRVITDHWYDWCVPDVGSKAYLLTSQGCGTVRFYGRIDDRSRDDLSTCMWRSGNTFQKRAPSDQAGNWRLDLVCVHLRGCRVGRALPQGSIVSSTH